MAKPPYRFNGIKNGFRTAWQEELIELSAYDSALISGYDVAGTRMELETFRRRAGTGIGQLKVSDCYFWGGQGIKGTDIHHAVLEDCHFLDNDDYENRKSTAIKWKSVNKANNLRVLGGTIQGYWRAMHIWGDMEGGLMRDTSITGGWNGIIREVPQEGFTWNRPEGTFTPGFSVYGQHISVANKAISCFFCSDMDIKDVLIHYQESEDEEVTWFEGHDADWLNNNFEALDKAKPGSDEAWVHHWRNEMARRKAA